MKDFDSTGLRVSNGELFVLNQTQLPHKEIWEQCRSPDDMERLIRTLGIRGAPAIGVAAACSLALYAESGADEAAIRAAGAQLRASRPTAVNLMWAVDRVLAADLSSATAVASVAEAIVNEDVQMCDNMADNGAALIQKGEQCLTICNTGGLATVGVGTAFGVLRRAHQQGKGIHVYVCETRPLLQGGRLTTWELSNAGVPYTLITDSMAASLMKAGRINRVLVGADRIALNGDFANKIGTYSLAVLARYHGIPFHPVAPRSTIDFHCASGDAIAIEQRRPEEVRGVALHTGAVTWAPDACDVYNPAFDVTPADLVTSLVLDSGVVQHDDLPGGAIGKLR